MCLTETWLSDKDNAVIAELVPETHSFHHFPREGRGGGVGIMVAQFVKNIKSVRRSYQYFECLEVSLNFRNKEVILYVIYRPPAGLVSRFVSEFESFLMQSQLSKKTVVYVGDFNIWIDDLRSSDTKQFTDILSNFYLKNFVNMSTFNSGHILDLVITTTGTSLIDGIGVESVCTISDHKLVSFVLNIDIVPKQIKMIYFRPRNSLNSNHFAYSLSILQTSVSLRCEHAVQNDHFHCTNCLIDRYKRTTTKYFYDHAPLVEKAIKVCDSNNLWYSPEIKNAKRLLRKSEKLFKKYKTDYYQDEYKRLRQAKCNLVLRAKISYYKEKINQCGDNSRKLFGQLNKLLGKSVRNDVLPQCDNDTLLSNLFKDFFLTKIHNINSSFKNDCSTAIPLIPDYPLVVFKEFALLNCDEVVKLIRKINRTYCLNDPFDVRLLNFEEVHEALASYFCMVINSSFEIGDFPSSEKFAIIRPLIKGHNNPDEFSSYRPLYNTSFISKILESAALNQLLSHLSRFQCFPKVQSAYRNFHSVESAMCKIYNDLVIRKCKGECTLLVMLDLSAAFDTVNHDILINDLKMLGLDGRVLNWFVSYLKDRNFCVSIRRETSDTGTMLTGIPQGTILGPVLFIIYTIELYYLLESLNVECHFYADDTQIYFSIESVQQSKSKFEEIYVAIKKWMNSRKLKLNAGKTEIMIVGSSARVRLLNNFTEMIVDGSVVVFSEQVKSLGVILDQGLSMKNQLSNTKKKAIYNLINISRISRFIDRGSRMKLIHGLVLTVIDFCNSLYYGLPNCDLHAFQMIINSAARIVEGMARFSRDRITPVCINLHFLPFKARIEYKICLLTYKALRFGEPKYLADLLTRFSTERDMSLRSIEFDRLDEPMISRLSTVNRCFAYSAPRLYNKIPHHIRQIDTVQLFKKKLKTFMFQKAYDMQTETINPEFAL